MSTEPVPYPVTWIPCAERLPDMRVDVLVSGEIGVTVGYRNDRTPHGSKMRGKVKWEWRADYGDDPAYVTHWMPLPEPPKGNV